MAYGSQKKIYNANKCNAFVITDETRSLSQKRGELILICHYKKPVLQDNKITYQWINKEVTISDLKFDSDNYKIYYYDFDTEEAKLNAILKSVTEWNEFEIYWLKRNNIPGNEKWHMERTWYRVFKDKNLIPVKAMNSVGFSEEIKQLFNALYSVKHKQMVNYNYQPNSWLQVSNLVLNSRKEFAGIYCRALKVYGLFDEVVKSDKKNTFQNKYKIILDGVKNNDPDYEQDLVYKPLLNELFPELYQK